MTLRGAFGLSELFFLTDCLLAIRGQSQLIGSSEPIVGLVGHDVILPCRLEPAANFAEKTVEWTRPDLNPGYVHVFRDGRVLYDQDHPSFKQRANLFLQELKNGNVSLKISQLQLSDKGQYTCHLPSLRSRSVITLVVGAVSEPTISIVNTNYRNRPAVRS
ncbi:myelin-oligodendrocyte glycoprotein-like [Centroberyx affinis]|uniref:myelin-oligodendrocyte glycoprotein-like n=1 Tax=Centroberyx affinis TaxID=166261 RepID=UPI003A5BA9CE